MEGWVERKYSGGIDVGDPVEEGWLDVEGDVVEVELVDVVEEEEVVDAEEDEEM